MLFVPRGTTIQPDHIFVPRGTWLGNYFYICRFVWCFITDGDFKNTSFLCDRRVSLVQVASSLAWLNASHRSQKANHTVGPMSKQFILIIISLASQHMFHLWYLPPSIMSYCFHPQKAPRHLSHL